jgi:hypothetical protein
MKSAHRLAICSLVLFVAFTALYLASALFLVSADVLRVASWALFAFAITGACFATTTVAIDEWKREHRSWAWSGIAGAACAAAFLGWLFGWIWGEILNTTTAAHPAPPIPPGAVVFFVAPLLTLAGIAHARRVARRAGHLA